MKILHVVAGLAKTGGGTSEVVPRLCEALSQTGDEVRLRTVELGELSDSTLRAQWKGVDVKVFARTGCVPRCLTLSASFWKNICSEVLWADVVHLHGLWESPCWLAARAARSARKPYVMMTHGFLEPERLKKSSMKKKIIGGLIERPLLSHAARVIATAESEKKSITTYGVKSPIEIVPIGIDTDEIDKAQRDEALLNRLGVPFGKKVLLYFSRLAPIKGLDMLADAWSTLGKFHQDWQLLIVGPDTQGYTEFVKQDFATKVKNGSVCICDPVFGLDKFSLLKSVDGFVLPTRSENFSIAVQEALAAGLPVVCTKGAPWATIEGTAHSGRCGWWVDIDARSISLGLEKLLSLSDEEKLQMSLQGKQLVKADFAWGSIATQMRKIYQTVIEES